MPKLPLLLCALIFWLPSYARAASFNPSLIVSDAFFTDSGTMDAKAIQVFLGSHGSILAGVPSSKLGGGAGGRSAAQIISDAARSAGPLPINPQVLLVTLQKEQSLVTRGSASAGTLDRAMGYGCPDAGGCAPRYAGFTNQVVNAAYQLARNFANASRSAFRPGQTVTIQNEGGAPDYPPEMQQVWIGNAASSALYQYTPHAYNGNKHFWSLTGSWFATPDQPYLAQAPGTVTYYVALGTRHRLAGSWLYPMLTLPSNSVRQLSGIQLSALRSGPAVGLPSREARSQATYLVTGGKKWRFPSSSMLTNWGFKPTEVETVDPDLLAPVPDGGTVGLLQRDSPDSAVSAIVSGKRFIASQQMLQAWGLQSVRPVMGGVELGYLLPLGGVLSRCLPHTFWSSYYLSFGKRYDMPSFICRPSLPYSLAPDLLPPRG